MSETSLSGILTFLFTDLEGSTPLWERHPDLMQEVSARHDELLRAAFAAHSGRVVKTTGDGFHVVFESPADGMAAALAGQQAITLEAWPKEIGPLKVRMGLHAGESQAREGDFYGPEINRAARLMGIGHGGQVLVSAAAAGLLRTRLPEGAALVDLGEHQLRGISFPEQVYQLSHPLLTTDFPALQSAASIPHNLPAQLTTFIGRASELAEVARLLESHRLLTLLGPGGTGKTRLMLQAAGDLIDRFPDGAWLVELAPLTDPDLVPDKAAGVLGVRGQPDRPLADSLVVYLRLKKILLLLDNAEHLIQAAAELAEHLLTGCPQLTILVTSREPLSIGGEATFRVPSLALPAGNPTTTDELAAAEAAQLFIERARAVRPDFQLTASSVPAVAEIVRQLDGIPLALELAAARLRVMSAEQIASRLNDRFRLLVGGRRTALPRQQTLKALIDWSWQLLDEDEQILLRRLSVFSGGWILEDAQQVAGDPPLDEFAILDNLEALVNKSLVTAGSRKEGGERFHLLETIRRYAWEQLSEAGEDEALSDHHAAYFCHLVRVAEASPTQLETVTWVGRLVRETDNFRAAFDWLETRNPMLFLATIGKLMVLGGQGFWSFSPPQARRWLVRAIEIGRNAVVVKENRREWQKHLGLALAAMGSVGFALGRHEEGVAAGEESISLLRLLGESQPLAYALGIYAFNLGFLGRIEEASEAGEEARAMAHRQDDGVPLSIALAALGLVTMIREDFDDAFQYLSEGKAVIEKLGSNWIGLQLVVMEGRLLANTGELARAEAVYRDASLQLLELGEPTQSAIARSEMAHALRGQGKWEPALAIYKETIQFFQEMGHEAAVANQLECIAYVAIAQESPEAAAPLLGAAQSIREQTKNPIHLPWETADYERAMQQLAEMLGRPGRDDAVAAGRSMTLDEAVVLARTVTEE